MAFQFTPPAAQPAEVSPDPQIGVIQSVPIKLIRVKPQFRKHFDEVRLAELTDSVRRYGVLQPVLVRPLGGVPVTGYQLVAGERRYRAANAAGLTEIPAHVRPMTDLEVLRKELDRAADDSKGAKKAKVAAHACPVCGTEFETWQQAQECKEECLAAQGSASPADTAEPAEPAPAPPAAPTPIVRRKRFPYACSRCGDVFITQDDAEKCELRCAAMPESNELTFTFEPSEGVTLAKAVVRAVHDPRDNWKVDVNLLVSECQGFKAPTSGRFRSFSNPRSAVVTGLEWIREYVIKERARPHGLSINEALKQVEDFAREWIDRLTGFLPDPPVPPPPAPPKKQRRKKKELAHV